MISTIVNEWMHLYFSQGIFDGELNGLMVASKRARHPSITIPCLKTYNESWTWPRSYATGKGVLDKGRLNGNASELLSFCPVLARWLQEKKDAGGVDAIADEVDSMLSLLDVADCLMLCQRKLCTPSLLGTSIDTHSARHLKAYGATLGNGRTIQRGASVINSNVTG